MDSMLVANEVLEVEVKMKTRGFLFNVEIEKASDHLNGVHFLILRGKIGFCC